MENLIIVKIGGKIIDQPAELDAFLQQFADLPPPKLLVHGGGRRASAVAEALEIKPQMVDGRRITDRQMLDVVTMVYGGLLNKTLVSKLQALGCDAIGLTGADANLIRAVKRPVREIDYGFAGDVEAVNAGRIGQFLKTGLVPVLAPLTHDKKGQLLNTNADTIAATVAGALVGTYSTRLLTCFEFPGILADVNHEDSVLPVLTWRQFKAMQDTGRISAGMIPKLDTAFTALQNGVREVVVCRAGDLRKIAEGTKNAGTRLIAEGTNLPEQESIS